MGAAVGGCQLHVISLAANSSLRALHGTDFTKIWAGPSASRSLVLKMKKLLNDGLDLNVTAKGQKEAMRED
jgi:hypothetical protein